jgi:hypothetical protein
MSVSEATHLALDWNLIPATILHPVVTPLIPTSIGAANPKAIAELKLGRTLDPNAPDFQATLSEALGLPFEQLFDPKFSSPVFAGLRIARDVVTPPADLKVAPAAAAAPPAPEVGAQAALAPAFVIPFPIWWPVSDLTFQVMGQFILDAPSATAPQQGALGDCWLISAMASVAWCHSDAITERVLKEGSGVIAGDGAAYEFTFFASPNWSQPKTLSVRVDLPEQNGQYIYACSTVAGETWPANLEKAFIGMRGPTGIFEPSSSNYNELNGGDPAWAVASLVGRPPWYHWANAADALATINAHCTNGVATEPMTAWTYGSAPSGASYDGSGIVGNHAYSILGTTTSGGQSYVVLRNPWAWHPGTLNVLSGTWEGLTLGNDGIFALRLDTFGQYYQGFGGA